ncbi:hypothetical protein [Haladaptatus sp. ZSTT2]|uniref:hypothetical protein n=1 Tax=Haladaptatus sp. ZSTT2 TaxID=3120515 RepID=UPI00300F0B87
MQVLPADGLASWFVSLGPGIEAISLTAVQWSSYAGALLVISLLAAFGYKSAIRRFDRYTIT